VTYTGFTNLKGAADNKDVFKVDTNGKISGTIDGGDRGFDTMEIVGTHASVSSAATGPNSGVVTVDGSPIAYAGLEPIVISSPIADVSVAGSGGDDTIT